jgi:hypothetical protein
MAERYGHSLVQMTLCLTVLFEKRFLLWEKFSSKRSRCSSSFLMCNISGVFVLMKLEISRKSVFDGPCLKTDSYFELWIITVRILRHRYFKIPSNIFLSSMCRSNLFLLYFIRRFQWSFYLIYNSIFIGIAKWYSAGLRAGWSGVRVPAEAGNYSLHNRVLTGSGSHPAGSCFHWGKGACAWCLQLTLI